jgi:hypothetical protein
MPAPAQYQSSIGYIVDGEAVEATVANRTAVQLKNNTDYLLSLVGQLSNNEYLVAVNQVVSSNTVVGHAVYYNQATARYEPAQAVAGKQDVVGLVLTKSGTTVANLLLAGTATLDITLALESGQSLTASRYYLSASTAGCLTTTAPTLPAGPTSPIQVAVLIADGAGKVYALPTALLVGAQGPQGPFAGPQGTQGTQGPQGRSVQGPQGTQGPQGGITGVVPIASGGTSGATEAAARANIGVDGITTDTDGATVTFNMAINHNHRVVLGGNRILALSNVVDGQEFTIILVQDGGGGRSVTWWSNIKWASGTVPTLTATGDAIDMFRFLRVSSSQYLGTIVGQNFS